jgi:hypothetical protein
MIIGMSKDTTTMPVSSDVRPQESYGGTGIM